MSLIVLSSALALSLSAAEAGDRRQPQPTGVDTAARILRIAGDGNSAPPSPHELKASRTGIEAIDRQNSGKAWRERIRMLRDAASRTKEEAVQLGQDAFEELEQALGQLEKRYETANERATSAWGETKTRLAALGTDAKRKLEDLSASAQESLADARNAAAEALAKFAEAIESESAR